MTYINDHTDAEIARRAHDYEMGAFSPSEVRWHQWCNAVEAIIGFDLDGDEEEDGYSLDYAHNAFEAGQTPAIYAAAVRSKRWELGL